MLHDGSEGAPRRTESAHSRSVVRHRLPRFRGRTGEQPALTVEGWLQVAEANEVAKRGNPLLIAKNSAERRAITMEQRFGGLADATLVGEGLVADDDSRWKLIEALARDLTEGAKKLARNADGD